MNRAKLVALTSPLALAACSKVSVPTCEAERCGSFAVTGQILKMAAAPGGATVYALQAGWPGQVIVFDASGHRETSRIHLSAAADDMDLSPNGQHLVVAHDADQTISVVDTSRPGEVARVPVALDPYRVEVDDAGIVYYVGLDQWQYVRRVDPAVGPASESEVSYGAYQPDIELSPDGAFLYVGQSELAPGWDALAKYSVSGPQVTMVGRSRWERPPYPAAKRYLYLGPDGTRIYYGDPVNVPGSFQLEATDLRFTAGFLRERILAEDRAGTIAVGGTTVFDAQTLRPIGTLPAPATLAVLVKDDAELWTYDVAAGRISWFQVADLVSGVALGIRSLPPEPLSSYDLSRLVHDPARPRLYGLDGSRSLVVAIDPETLTPLGAVIVGSYASDLAISLEGDALWVGHWATLGVARIDLASFTFDGFVVLPRIPFEVEALAGGRLAFIDEEQWTTPGILDPASGAVTDGGDAYFGALAAAADGTALFVAESFSSGCSMIRYDVSGGTFVKVAETSYDGGYGFPSPPRHAVALRDGSAVYYAGFLIDGADLATLRYAQPDLIRAVTPDGRIATSFTKVYRVSDGAVLGTVSTAGSPKPVQAVSPDGKTLYVATYGGVAKVDLSRY